MPLGVGRLLSDIETQIRPIEQDADIARAARLLGPALWARVWVQFLQGRRSPRRVVGVSFVETPSPLATVPASSRGFSFRPGTCQIEHAQLPPKVLSAFSDMRLWCGDNPGLAEKRGKEGVEDGGDQFPLSPGESDTRILLPSIF